MVGVSLFSGAGGMDVGFARAGLHAVLAVEQWAPAAQTLRANFANVQVLECRVEDVRWELYADGGPVDVVWGGPPCQPFSVAGKGGGQYDPRDGFPAAIAAVRALAPRAFVWENVEALVWRKHGAYTEGVMAALRALGYSVELRRLNAADYGVPQVRRRCFMVGLRSDVGRRFEWPAPTHGVFGVPHTSVRQALGLAVSPGPQLAQSNGRFKADPVDMGAPARTVGARTAKDKPDMTTTVARKASAATLRKHPGMHADAPAAAPAAALRSGGSGHSAPHQYVRASAVANGTLAPSAAYGRKAGGLHKGERTLDADAPANSQQGAGGQDFVPDGVRYRRLTWQECAALQAFPPDYVWCGSASARYGQIGNAVPPPLAEVVARQLLEALA